MPRSGADADALEQVGRELVSSAEDVGRTRTVLRSQLYTSHWEGPSADRFRQKWDAVHGPALADAQQFLRTAGVRLHDNAQAQRDASAGEGGSIRLSTPLIDAGSGGDEHSDEDARALLSALGLTDEQVEAMLKMLEGLGDISEIIKMLSEIGKNGVIKAIVSGIDKVFDVVQILVDFTRDLMENPNLPDDERVLHAISDAALRFAVSEGAEKAADFATKALLTAVLGPVGAAGATVAGPVVGYLVGELMDWATNAVDGQFDVFDGAADGITDMYCYAKEKDFDMGAIAWDQAGNIAEGVINTAENVGEKIGGGIEAVGGFIGGLL